MSGAGPVLVPGEPPRLGRFRIAARIGAGSISDVYLAMDTREGAWRALKVLAFPRMGDERARARFARECETALRVSHPHLLTAFDAAPDDPYTPWLALEVCEGGSLADWIDRHGPMPSYLAIEVMVQVCSGLAAAHRRSVALRRLEPRDVLIDRHGKCRLIDFRSVPGHGGPLGSDSVDLRNDVVAAGSLLHFLLTGRPYDDRHPLRDVPECLHGVVTRAVQRGRGRGYPDAAAMGRDLEAAMLDVALPVGVAPRLVDDDVALPDTLEAVFDPEAGGFEHLERAARWAADPDAGPDQVGDAILGLLASGAPRSEPSVVPVGPRSALPGTPAPSPRSVAPPSGATAPAPGDRLVRPELVTAAVAAPFQRDTPGLGPFRAAPHGRLTAEEIERRGLVTPAPVSRVGRAGADYRPDYIVEEPRHARDDGWLRATPDPTPRVAAPPRRQVDPRLIVAALVLVALAIVGLFAKGAWDVRQARLVADDAGENLTAIVEAEGAVVNDLAARGANRGLLEERFFAYREARGHVRYAAAEAFAATLLSEAGAVGVDPAAPVKDSVTERVSAIVDARARYLRERQAWAHTASGFPGALPVLVGLSSSPE